MTSNLVSSPSIPVTSATPGGAPVAGDSLHDVPALVRLLEFTNRLGFVYGSEDISLLLYSLIRRERPENILELGTGLGVSTFWMAQALRENGTGRIATFDDGSHWEKAGEVEEAARLLAGVEPFDALAPDELDYPNFITNITALLDLDAQIAFHKEYIDLTDDNALQGERYAFLKTPIDMVFADFSRGPDDILDILFLLLPHMAECASLFIDSASTSLSGYLFLEKLVDQLNHSKVPRRFLMSGSKEQQQKLVGLVAQRRFTLVHLVEKKAREQNSTAWIKIEPNDYVPHPMTLMKM